MLKLFMILLGCKPAGRHTEQHDIFFGIAPSLPHLLPDLLAFWPGAIKLHIDAWREVTLVDGFSVNIIERRNRQDAVATGSEQLFFINLGGYKEQDFEEYHYKILSVNPQKSGAIQQAKQTAFFKHTCFEGADSHIDDKYGVDVDDVYEIEDILPADEEKYAIQVVPVQAMPADEWHLGYTKLSLLEKM